MAQYTDSIENILSKAKVKPENSEKNINKNTNHIIISRCNFGNSTFLLGLIALIGLAVIFGILHTQRGTFPARLTATSVVSEDVSEPISIEKALEIKELVAAVSDCELKHPNTVHNELKRKLHYRNYKKVDYDTYLKIKEILVPRAECI